MTGQGPKTGDKTNRRRTPRPRLRDIQPNRRIRHDLLGRCRLGWGELADPHLSRDVARSWFFRAVEDAVPWVRESLVQFVLPHYSAFFEEVVGAEKPDHPGDEDFLTKALGRFNTYVLTLPESGRRRALFDWRMLRAAEPACSSLPPLRAWLEGWGTEFALLDPWCYDIALSTLLQYQINELLDYPDNVRPHRFVSPALSIPSPPGLNVPSQAEDLTSTGEDGIWPPGGPYDPYRETRAEAKVRLSRYLGRSTDDYLNQAEAACKGAKRAQQRAEEHFRWLARHQCLAESCLEIAHAEWRHPSSVATPVAELTLLLGLTPRKSKRGRPRGIRETKPRNRDLG
jgi:hypothetical protein